MAGKKGMRWSRNIRDPETIEEIRKTIDAFSIAKELKAHIFGQKEMSPTQVTAAVALLRKCLPDLSASDISAHVEHVHTSEADVFSRLVSDVAGRDADSEAEKPTAH